MKKSRLLLLIAATIIIPVILCSCSLFSLFGLTGTVQLAVPKDIQLSGDCSYIEWDSVTNATKYEIFIDGSKADEVSAARYYFEDIDGAVSLQVRAVSSSRKYTPSALSAATELIVKSRLKISGISHLIGTTDFYVYWADNEYKLKYLVRVYKNEALLLEDEVFNPSVLLSVYDSEAEYAFKIIAVADSSGKRVNSAEASYTVPAGSAASTAERVEYDKRNNEGVALDNVNPSASRVYLTVSGARTDITSQCLITADKVTISSSYMNTLPPTVYSGELDVARKCFMLIISDTRELELENCNFVKNFDYAEIDVEIYNNTIIDIDISGVKGHAYYDFVSDKIIVDGEYLDTLEDDAYVINVEYGQGNEIKFESASLNVVSLPATIPASSVYNHHGQYPLNISFSQNGDSIVSLVLADYGAVAVEEYTKVKNSIIIGKEFLLARGNGTFSYCINTAKGAALSFTVITDIRNFALQYSEYDYDKASGADVTIGAIIVAINEFEGLYGASITESDYRIDTDVGIIIDKNFAARLSRGEHKFLCISGGIEDYFTLIVTNSVHKPYNVKLNYDISASNVYVTFKSDSTGNHTYSLNGGPETICPSKKFALSGYDKSAANTLRITCVASGLSTTITKSAPAAAALVYIGSRYTFEGENHDKYIESQEELNHYMKYLVFTGDASEVDPIRKYGYVEGSFYFAPEFIADTTSSAALNAALASFTSPWGFQVSSSTLSNRVDVNISYSQYPGYDYTTEYAVIASLDTRDLLKSSSRSASFNAFYIEKSANPSQAVRNTLELVELPLGVRPVVAPASDAEELYAAAKAICRGIIDDTMSEREKVAAIYYWLTTNVSYDYDSIALYNLFTQINAMSSVAAMRLAIDDFINSRPEYADFLNPIRAKDTIDGLKAEFNSSIKRMRVFSAEGAIIDKKAVCNGTAYAFLLLCKIEGITCIKVSGTAFSNSGSENHSWNKVKLDGVWYLVDATWGRLGNFVSHKYLMVSDFSVFDTHREEAGENGIRNIEYVSSGHHDYYSKIIIGDYDLCIDSFEELKAVVSKLYSDGERTIELKYNLSQSFASAIATALKGVHKGGYQNVNAGDIYIVNFN